MPVNDTAGKPRSTINWPAATAVMLLGLVCCEQVALAFAAMMYGGLGPLAAAHTAFKDFELVGYAFFSLFRLVPYGLLALLILVTQTRRRRHAHIIAAAGVVSLWAFWFPLTISLFRPLYTAEHVSSTSAIALVFVPLYAVVPMLVGYLLAWSIVRLAEWLDV